jgi:hypothetical protein
LSRNFHIDNAIQRIPHPNSGPTDCNSLRIRSPYALPSLLLLDPLCSAHSLMRQAHSDSPPLISVPRHHSLAWPFFPFFGALHFRYGTSFGGGKNEALSRMLEKNVTLDVAFIRVALVLLVVVEQTPYNVKQCKAPSQTLLIIGLT